MIKTDSVEGAIVELIGAAHLELKKLRTEVTTLRDGLRRSEEEIEFLQGIINKHGLMDKKEKT